MAITEFASLSAVTVGASELSIISGTTTLQTSTSNGVYSLMVDAVGALAKSDYFRWRIYEKVLSAGTKRVLMSGVIGAVTASEPIVIPSTMLKNGWDMTLQKIAGTDRAFDASIRGVATSITEAYTRTALSVTTTELSLTGGTSTLLTKAEAGVFQLFVDPVTNMVKGDEFDIRIYETTKNTKRQIFRQTIMDTNSRNWSSPMLNLLTGWEMTMKAVSASARAFDASIRKVA